MPAAGESGSSGCLTVLAPRCVTPRDVHLCLSDSTSWWPNPQLSLPTFSTHLTQILPQEYIRCLHSWSQQFVNLEAEHLQSWCTEEPPPSLYVLLLATCGAEGSIRASARWLCPNSQKKIRAVMVLLLEYEFFSPLPHAREISRCDLRNKYVTSQKTAQVQHLQHLLSGALATGNSKMR